MNFLSQCISQVKEWMLQNLTVLTVKRLSSFLSVHPNNSLIVDNSIMESRPKLKHLRVIFDSSLIFAPYVQSTIKTYFFHLRN